MARRDRTPTSGFTLIELVMAVGLIGFSFMSLLFIRASAIEKAAQFNIDRSVQRMAQEKLDEVVYGIEENQDGTFEEEPDWEWSVEVFSLDESGSLFPLLECTITLLYPSEDPEGGDGEYQLATRFFVDEEHPLYEFAGVDDEDN